MFRFRSYRTRLQAVFLLLGLTAVGLTGWEASSNATAALQDATFDRLTAIRETRVRQIDRYFLDLGNHVIALSTDESTILALEQFLATWPQIPKLSASQTEELRSFYDGLQERLRPPDPAGPSLKDGWFPNDEAARTLQYIYIAQNPYPLGSRLHLLSAPAAGPYGEVHARFHPTLYRYLRAFGFYDIFLIDADQGRLLYTVKKEIDVGTALTKEPYHHTTLAAAWRRAMALDEAETFVVEDFAPYLPSHFAPAAFVAAPIYRAGIKIGVLAIQLSIQEINGMMTAGGAWRQEGFGETGQAYLASNDGTLRSDLRNELEDPQSFYRRLAEVGRPESLISRIRRYGTAVLNLNVLDGGQPPPGQEYTGPARNFLGEAVLRSQAPLHLQGLSWTVVAEIGRAEALAPVNDLRWRILGQALILAGFLVVAARLFASRLTRHLLRVAQGAVRLGKRDFDVRLPVESDDEVGQLAAAFNRMAADLEQTTVSKHEVDRMLSSLINAVFVIVTGPGAEADDVLDAPVHRINPAGLALLGAEDEEAGTLTLRRMVPADDITAWRIRIARVLHEGRLPASEAVLCPRSGARVPVLFAASWLSEEDGGLPGLVCVAQDISEWKATQAKLREKQVELELLTGRLISAQEEERARLARELHDDLTQRLAAVAIEAGQLERMKTAGEDERRYSMLRRIKEQMAQLSREVHGLSRRLHPSTLDDLGLVAAIESETRAFFERGGPPVNVTSDELPPLSRDTQLGLYRIVQEALHNVAKHANAEEVRISLSALNGAVQLVISDDGRGFDRALPAWRPGLGLASMEERIRILGGSLHVASTPGHGTRITVRVPLENRYAKTEGITG
jgi:PAS domain S-box-containing protein